MYIIFDVDDTLYDLMQPFVLTHEELFGDEGRRALENKEELKDLPYQKKVEWLFKRSRYHSEDAFYRWSKGEIDKSEEFRYRVVMTYRDIGIAVDAERADQFKERYRYYQHHITAFPGIQELLTQLAGAGIKLGVITNGKHKNQLRKVEALQLTDLIPVDKIFISEDLPAPKPELLAFRTVEQALGIRTEILDEDRTETGGFCEEGKSDSEKSENVKREQAQEEIWYIGDNYEVDVLGAKGAGWHAIWFNHRGKQIEVGSPDDADAQQNGDAKEQITKEPVSVADFEVRSVEELTSTLWNIVYKGNPYYSLNQYLRNRFGEKVYKIALDGGMTCPNRDGTLGTGGCIFCSSGGSGEFAQKLETTITEQIEEAKVRIQKKTDAKKFIAYFQSYTNTYAPVDYLRKLFTEAISHPEVAVLSIGTRPDCLPQEVLDLLEELNQIKPVWVELGLQTIHEETARYIRRGYALPVYEEAVEALHARGIEVITHVILGLPGETKEMMLDTIRYLAGSEQERSTEQQPGGRKRTDGIKLQLLHVLQGTDLAAEYEAGKCEVMSMEAYFEVLLEAVALLPKDMVIHRLTGDGPKRILIAPQWSGNKKLVLNELNRRFRWYRRDVSF